MPRKISKKGIITKLDDLVSKYVIERDKICVTCGSKKQLTNGHLFSRTHQVVRWDIRDDGNCHCQCWPCNFLHVHDKYRYEKWFIEKFGMKRFDDLHAEWTQKTTHNKVWQLVDLHITLQEQITDKFGHRLEL